MCGDVSSPAGKRFCAREEISRSRATKASSSWMGIMRTNEGTCKIKMERGGTRADEGGQKMTELAGVDDKFATRRV